MISSVGHPRAILAMLLGVLLGIVGTALVSVPAASAFAGIASTESHSYTYDLPHGLSLPHAVESAGRVPSDRTLAVGREGAVVVRDSVDAANTAPRVFVSAGGKAAATDWAAANGGQTINQTLTGKALGSLDAVPYRFTRPLWNAASARFASGTTDVAHVFLGPDGPLRSTIFWKTELPILRENGVDLIQHGGWTNDG